VVIHDITASFISTLISTTAQVI